MTLVLQILATVCAVFGSIAVGMPDERTRGLDPRIGWVVGLWIFGILFLAIWRPW